MERRGQWPPSRLCCPGHTWTGREICQGSALRIWWLGGVRMTPFLHLVGRGCAGSVGWAPAPPRATDVDNHWLRLDRLWAKSSEILQGKSWGIRIEGDQANPKLTWNPPSPFSEGEEPPGSSDPCQAAAAVFLVPFLTFGGAPCHCFLGLGMQPLKWFYHMLLLH